MTPPDMIKQNDEDLANCNLEDIELEVEPGVMIKICVIKPKSLPKTGNAGYFYCHGGGGVVMEHYFSTPLCAHIALNLDCVVFNVNYRKAPEAKCPKGQQDVVTAIEHVYNNADKFGINNQ